ncbi:MAG: hypothetical protein ABI610_00505 [Acidobacteriota bacterium]
MRRLSLGLRVFLLAAAVVGLAAPGRAGEFSIARIYIEYNAIPNDLGYHVSLDGEDWKSLKIVDPNGKTIFDVTGKGAYKDLGMTELFFEGAEPNLADFLLADLLALFPEGVYTFSGVTVDGERLVSTSTLTHAVPARPPASASVNGDTVVISWSHVTSPPAGFPNRPIVISGYQILADSFQVTLPASATQVTLPIEFVQWLAPGAHPFEVLAIEVGGNQTITEGTYVTE